VTKSVALLVRQLHVNGRFTSARGPAVATPEPAAAGATAVAIFAVVAAGLPAQAIPAGVEGNWAADAALRRDGARAAQILTERSLSALPTTETDDRLIAAAAIIGESRRPTNG
jgi:hypothetical protein